MYTNIFRQNIRMKMSATDTTVRKVLLSVLFATLIVTAGCAGIHSGESRNGSETPTSTTMNEMHNTSSADGVDLRRISIPDNGSVTRSGELDRGDPKSGNKYYEPIQVDAVEGQVVNITMRAENGNPGLRIVNPDGNVTATISNKSGTATGFIRGSFAQTGRYTIEATSVSQNTTFNYSLTIERSEDRKEEETLLAGSKSEFSETEKYLAFGRDMAYATAETADYGQYSRNVTGTEFQSNVSGPDIQANASADYIVITYQTSNNNTFSKLQDIDNAFLLSHQNLWETYTDLGNDTSVAEDGSWVPDIVFLRGLNESGELYRTHFITTDWARTYAQSDKNESAIDRYLMRHGSTTRIGPGAPYNRSNYPQVTPISDEEFPEAYWNFTFDGGSTLADLYRD